MANVVIPAEDFSAFMNDGNAQAQNRVKSKYWQQRPLLVLHGLVFTTDDLNPDGDLDEAQIASRYEKVNKALENDELQEEIGAFVRGKIMQILA
jgi:hypothetical protein